MACAVNALKPQKVGGARLSCYTELPVLRHWQLVETRCQPIAAKLATFSSPLRCSGSIQSQLGCLLCTLKRDNHHCAGQHSRVHCSSLLVQDNELIKSRYQLCPGAPERESLGITPTSSRCGIRKLRLAVCGTGLARCR